MVENAHRYGSLSLKGDWYATACTMAAGSVAGESASGGEAAASGAVRHLTAGEIERLIADGNRALSWSDVLVTVDFLPDFVIGNLFIGPCILGRFAPEAGEAAESQLGEARLPSGIYHCTLDRAIIESGAALHRCPLVSGYRIAGCATVADSTLVFEGVCSFANGMSVPAGNESGGRQITIHADMTLNEAREAAERTSTDRQQPGDIRATLGFVGPYSRLSACTRISNTFVGGYTKLVGAQLVDESTLLSTRDEVTTVCSGAIVRSSILQPGVSVTDCAIVDHSLLLEHSHADRHAKVTGSIIGPNSGIGEGEVTASFVGPFVGFHHQALLIAAFWPEGKGNIGYGANVGSNHTSRRPDQELRPGEGMFFGLGCNIKYPANFHASPYSIVATGVSTLPQRLSMPFSLIVEPETHPEGVPGGLCLLRPAWVLSDNLYMVWRSRMKYRERNQARRNAIPNEVFRDEIVAMMAAAAGALETAKGDRSIYTPLEIPEIGKNFVTESDRAKAVQTYRFFVQFAGLAGLFANLPQSVSRQDRERYREAVDYVAALVRASREKDDERGGRIMDNYERTHVRAEFDPVVQDAAAWAAEEIARVGGA